MGLVPAGWLGRLTNLGEKKLKRVNTFRGGDQGGVCHAGEGLVLIARKRRVRPMEEGGPWGEGVWSSDSDGGGGHRRKKRAA